MNTIKDIYSLSTTRMGEFGIELETSTVRPYTMPKLSFWEAKGDQSLRDFGIEYVLRTPKDYKAVPKTLKHFDDTMEESTIRFHNDVYCSTHVHINIKKFTPQQLLNLICLWILFEDTLLSYCGEDRDGNLFCLKNKQAEFIYYSLCKNLADSNNINRVFTFSSGTFKYGAINLATISTLGSLEVRCHPAFSSKAMEIMPWVDILKALKEAALSYESPEDLVNSLLSTTNEEFFTSIFGELVKHFSVSGVFVDETIEENKHYLFMINSSWKGFTANEENNSDVQEQTQSVSGSSERARSQYEWTNWTAINTQPYEGIRRSTVRIAT
jgi:hypothetical protein